MRQVLTGVDLIHGYRPTRTRLVRVIGRLPRIMVYFRQHREQK
jgi:hypothetical protein